MTNILRSILPNHKQVDALHLAIENKSFLLRYMGREKDQLTLLDHYRHLVQLKCLYTTFGELLQHPDFTPPLPDHLKSLLNRADKIQQDLNFLSPFLADKDKDKLCMATIGYTTMLRTLPINKNDERNNELLIHFIVSLLGDLNGGQFLKNYVKELYKRSGIYSEDAPDNGVYFYCFEKGIATRLTEWLKTFIKFKNPNDPDSVVEKSDNSKRLGDGAVSAFTYQAAIVDELEATRKSLTSTAKNKSSFFNCESALKVAALGGLTLATGAALSMLINN